MTDKEVGELWHKHYVPNPKEEVLEVLDLIRKLVEERAKAIEEYGRPWNELQTPHVDLALRDFGIDPKTWK